MRFIKTEFKGLYIIENDVYSDSRGWFTETYAKSNFEDKGIKADFIQDNHSYSTNKGTLRGIHFQKEPKAQAKLVRCTRGAILDIAVDLRKGSDTYKKSYAVELSEENKKQLFIPKGFGHAFLTLENDVEVQYKVNEYYSKEHDRSIRYDDVELNIDWKTEKPILSEKDMNAPFLKESDADFSIKVLVTGVNGQLGHEVVKRLNKLGITAIGADKNDFDIADGQQTFDYIDKVRPDVVVHCAAYTAVDKAEEDKKKCYAINVEGTRNIAEACNKLDAKMVYISTDYVFDGEGEEAQPVDKPTAPVNYYGYTKEQGEALVRSLVEKHFIIRTSWVYGRNGNNFVKTMLKLAQGRNEISVVNDQIGTPTYAVDLAVLICDMLQTRAYGTYHGVNEGYCSWYEFATAIFEKVGLNVRVNPIPSSEYPTKARRPLNSRLSKEKLDINGFYRLPDWADALSRYLKEQE